MNTRLSKKMVQFRRRVCKIIVAYIVISFICMVYQCKISDNTTSQFIDQKYEYISKNNESYGDAYSVDKLNITGGDIETKFDQPKIENVKKFENQIFHFTNDEKKEID